MIDNESKWVALSVDLEPNKDGSLDGIRDAMKWFDRTVPRGTVYTTYRIATELPDVVSMLTENHEVAVHVHPQEFGHRHDQLAELTAERQHELIQVTREALANASNLSLTDIVSFRAGRHSANLETFAILADNGFKVDASLNVRYTDYLPMSLIKQTEPFQMENGMLELPTTYYRPPFLSRVGVRIFPQRTLTATANTLRTDSPICSGEQAIRNLFSSVDDGVSMYMHPYDMTEYHLDLENNGATFRRRMSTVLSDIEEGRKYVSATDVVNCLM